MNRDGEDGQPGSDPAVGRWNWLLAYAPALRAGFIWDDDTFLTDNPLIQARDGMYRFWATTAPPDYFPLTSSMLWVEWRLWGNHTAGYHLVNVLLHAASAILLWRLLWTVKVTGACLAGLLFALHPVNVESVAWITELKNVLSGVLYLGAALAYLHFDDSRRRPYYALALFVLALLSKTVTATLPAALLVVFWWRRGRLGWRRDVLPLLPLFLCGAAGGLFTAWAERTLIGPRARSFSLRSSSVA